MQGIQFIGTQRSGSNLLRLMLNQLPAISAPHPPHILSTFIPLIEGYGELESAQYFNTLVKDVLNWVKANPVAWTNWDMDESEIISRIHDNSIESLFAAIYELKALRDEASMWCCKSLANVQFVDRIESKNIHPIYIHLVRDGRDVACSFKNAIVGPKHVYHLAKKWSYEQRLAHEVGLKYPGRYVLIKYEDLIEHPSQEVERICDAVGIAYSPQVMNYYKSKESEITAKSGDMWKNVINPVIADNRYKYREGLSQDEIGLFNQVAGSELKQYGYDLESDRGILEIDNGQIQRYNDENDLLIQGAKNSASTTDKALRKPQEELLAKIKNRIYSYEL